MKGLKLRDFESMGAGFIRDRKTGRNRFVGTMYFGNNDSADIETIIYPSGGSLIIGPATEDDKESYNRMESYIKKEYGEKKLATFLCKRKWINIMSNAAIAIGLFTTTSSTLIAMEAPYFDNIAITGMDILITLALIYLKGFSRRNL